MNISSNNTVQLWVHVWLQRMRTYLENYPDKPHLWFRYIDDILVAWAHAEEKLDTSL